MFTKFTELKDRDKLEVIQYLVLVLLFSVASVLFYQVVSAVLKFYIILIFACLYVAWGYWHHHHLKRLDKLIIFEYFLVSLVVVLLTALGLGIIRFL